jgi:hypothetical protein
MHRYLLAGVEEGTPWHDNSSQQLSVEAAGLNSNKSKADTSPFEKCDPLLQIAMAGTKSKTCQSATHARGGPPRAEKGKEKSREIGAPLRLKLGLGEMGHSPKAMECDENGKTGSSLQKMITDNWGDIYDDYSIYDDYRHSRPSTASKALHSSTFSTNTGSKFHLQ